MGTSAEGTVSCPCGLAPALATALTVLLLAGSQALLLLQPCRCPYPQDRPGSRPTRRDVGRPSPSWSNVWKGVQR